MAKKKLRSKVKSTIAESVLAKQLDEIAALSERKRWDAAREKLEPLVARYPNNLEALEQLFTSATSSRTCADVNTPLRAWRARGSTFGQTQTPNFSNWKRCGCACTCLAGRVKCCGAKIGSKWKT